MPTLNQLRGLKALDRSQEEQKAINQQMGYKEPEETIPVGTTSSPTSFTPSARFEEQVDTPSAALINQALRYQRHLDSEYEKALAERNQFYGTGHENAINTTANQRFDQIANDASAYYKRYQGTDKLPIDDQEKKQLVAQYDARTKAYGEDNANIWLDRQMKEKVANNQSWWEQGLSAVSHLIPAIEGGAIQAFGNLYGALEPIVGAIDSDLALPDNPDLGWWDQYLDHIIDNPVTRYGRDVEHAGASNVVQGLANAIGLMDESAAERIHRTKASATKYNPEGIGSDMIVTTEEQDASLLSSATPWEALQSGGFTALSMLVGAGEAKAAGWIFNTAAKGTKWLNSTGRAFKTAEGLEKALVNIKRAQNFTDTFVIPAAVGSMEGAMEGLNTKIDVEREAVESLDNYYREKVSKEAEETGQNFEDVWKKYEPQYMEARRQIDWASSKAGIHNFYANSLINGAINQTLKAGLMAPRVQETLRNSRWIGWAYRNPKFQVNTETGAVTPKTSVLGRALQVLKEPAGEGMEEYMQSLSNDVFTGAAENNINEFIRNKFEGDGTAKVTDSFGSDYAAALTALGESLVNKESIESAILGAVSSTMGTVGGVGRGYHRDANGNLVRNSLLDARNFTRGLDAEGNQESWMDYTRRITPWRSGAINAYFDQRQEQAEANETAAQLTEWLKDPQNKAKWDGLTGTANWMTQMENAAESNDQFSYRKAQMGKAINDIFMLKKLEGTDFHETIMTDLQRAANGEVSQEEIQKLKENGGEDYQNVSDQEVAEKIQSNANRMLGLMTRVETESKNLDRLMGRMDGDTKQGLIFDKVMEQDFTKRRDQMINPELSIEQAREDYRKKGYSERWINQRMKGIEARNELTEEWDKRGVQKKQYAILTDDITKTWSDRTTSQYKQLKRLDPKKKESLRDNMTTIELALNTLAEASTTEISRKVKPKTFAENRSVAKKGGNVAKIARNNLEEQLGRSVITSQRASDYLPQQLKRKELESKKDDDDEV